MLETGTLAVAVKRDVFVGGEGLRGKRGLRVSGFPLWHEEALHRNAAGELEIFAGIRDFREHLGGELCVTFPQGIGARFEVHDIDL